MKFKLKADVEFEADSIVDALEKLKEHFEKMSNMEDSSLFDGGEIQIYPTNKQEQE